MHPADIGRVFFDGTAGLILSGTVAVVGTLLLGARRLIERLRK